MVAVMAPAGVYHRWLSVDLNHFEDPTMFLLHCLLDKDEDDDDDDGEVTLTLHAQSPQQQTSFWFQVCFGVVVAVTHTSDPGCGGLSWEMKVTELFSSSYMLTTMLTADASDSDTSNGWVCSSVTAGPASSPPVVSDDIIWKDRRKCENIFFLIVFSSYRESGPDNVTRKVLGCQLLNKYPAK